MSNIGRLVAAVRNARTVAAALRRAHDDAGAIVPRSTLTPRASASPSRAQLRVQRRRGAHMFRAQWHGDAPPVWHLHDGRHFDWLRVAALRAARARQAAALAPGMTLHAVGTPCGLGAASQARTGGDTDACAHGPREGDARARRRTRTHDAARLAQLHRAARALTRLALPAPPRTRPCAARVAAPL